MRLKSVVTGNSSMSPEWLAVISQSMQETGQLYKLESSNSLGGVFGAILVRKAAQIPIIVNPPDHVRLGSHGMTANKSGVIFRAEFGCHARATFVGCHLSAHAENAELRTQELINLISRASVDADFVVLGGDLNYRLETGYERALQLIQEGNIGGLLQTDQLIAIRSRDSRLKDLTEAEITFPPTYKFDPDSDRYDTSPKLRTPSYTDRVLIRTLPPRLAVGKAENCIFETDLIRLIAPDSPGFCTVPRLSLDMAPPTFPVPPVFEKYESLSTKFSDHRPVHCQFVLEVPIEVPEKRKEFEALRLQKLEEMQLLSIPILRVPNSVEITAMSTIEIELSNPSIAWAKWKVECIGAGVNVQPPHGIVFPGIPERILVSAEAFSELPVRINFRNEALVLATLIVVIRQRKVVSDAKKITLATFLRALDGPL
jgi:hypothetical protein